MSKFSEVVSAKFSEYASTALGIVRNIVAGKADVENAREQVSYSLIRIASLEAVHHIKFKASDYLVDVFGKAGLAANESVVKSFRSLLSQCRSVAKMALDREDVTQLARWIDGEYDVSPWSYRKQFAEKQDATEATLRKAIEILSVDDERRNSFLAKLEIETRKADAIAEIIGSLN